MATPRTASATTMTRPTRSWSQVMVGDRFMSGAAQEVADVWIVGGGHLFRRAAESNVALAQHGDVGRHVEHRANVVRHHHAGHVELALELLDVPRDRARGERIQPGSGLVVEHDL